MKNTSEKYTFPLLETIRLQDGKIYNLPFHQRRMNKSFRLLFGGDSPFDLKEILNRKKWPEDGLYKIRFLYGQSSFRLEYSAYKPKIIRTLRIVQADDVAYHLKFTDRSAINRLVKKRGNADDILMLKEGRITDTSFANIAFFDGKDWWTPENPLLEGTMREWLLRRGTLKTAPITPADLKKYTHFKILNAMLDFDRQIPLPVTYILH